MLRIIHIQLLCALCIMMPKVHYAIQSENPYTILLLEMEDQRLTIEQIKANASLNFFEKLILKKTIKKIKRKAKRYNNKRGKGKLYDHNLARANSQSIASVVSVGIMVLAISLTFIFSGFWILALLAALSGIITGVTALSNLNKSIAHDYEKRPIRRSAILGIVLGSTPIILTIGLIILLINAYD